MAKDVLQVIVPPSDGPGEEDALASTHAMHSMPSNRGTFDLP